MVNNGQDQSMETYQRFMPMPWTAYDVLHLACDRARSAGWTNVQVVHKGHTDRVVGIPPAEEDQE